MKEMIVAALIIGRGNNTLQDKNIRPVLGRPLLHWPALAAKRSKYISSYYISSDCARILGAGKDVGYTPIVRPPELATATAQSSDAVAHAYACIEKEVSADILVVMHANVGTITSEMIDECIELMVANPEASSVIPSHHKDEYHPYRAKRVDDDGYLTPAVDFKGRHVSANRQDLDECVFFDHSFWVLSVEKGVKAPGGQPPWHCMGDRILPYRTSGCFDVHDFEDLRRTEDWITKNGVLGVYREEGLIG